METTLNKGLPLDITDKNFIRIPHLISEEEEEPINCSSLPPSHSLSLLQPNIFAPLFRFASPLWP